ncbi:MAG TPA: hypothetical protein VM204_05990, partial [Gaiellaceae bacterium]|nr:hypothetical protein [Gaiellaceae bacterium]
VRVRVDHAPALAASGGGSRVDPREERRGGVDAVGGAGTTGGDADGIDAAAPLFPRIDAATAA